MLRFEVTDDAVGRIILDRPEAANALTPRCGTTWWMRCGAAGPTMPCAASSSRANGDAFCSGMDLRDSTVSRAGNDGFDPRSTSQALHAGVQAFIREIWELDKPTVAAVQWPRRRPRCAPGPGVRLRVRVRRH